MPQLGPDLKSNDSNYRDLCKYTVVLGYQWYTRLFFNPKSSVSDLETEFWVFFVTARDKKGSITTGFLMKLVLLLQVC